MQYLRSIDLGDRVVILLNRHHKRNAIELREVEALVGAPVLMTFQNDYTRLAKAISQGDRVDPNSELGKQCSALAAYMMDNSNAAAPPQRRKFVEYFTIAPARYTFEARP
jgi:Flp pilus assembly CpaE family ATPase